MYEVEREGEVARFNKGGAGLPNHRLLWHGSRLSNYAGAPLRGGGPGCRPVLCPHLLTLNAVLPAGILSQGLRIAPPEAPVTGYMFGKGASCPLYTGVPGGTDLVPPLCAQACTSRTA